LPDAKPIKHLRSVLVATGALPPRDEYLIRLEQWITTTLAGRDDPDERQLLHRYAVWHALHRLRRRNNGTYAPHDQAVVVQQHVRAAIALLDWLTSHGLDLASAGQGDLDTWLTSEHATRQKLTRLDFAATKWDGPSGVIDAEARWQQARRLLHDDTVKPEDRVAGLLVLLYAQWPATISRLSLDHVQANEHQVRLRLGREPIVLPEPLAALRSAPRRLPPRPRDPRRPRNLPLAAPWRAPRPTDQRLPAGRTPATTRTAPWPRPLDRTVRPRYRTARSPAHPTARHRHQRRRRLATRQQRGLDQLRRRLQPPRTGLERGRR